MLLHQTWDRQQSVHNQAAAVMRMKCLSSDAHAPCLNDDVLNSPAMPPPTLSCDSACAVAHVTTPELNDIPKSNGIHGAQHQCGSKEPPCACSSPYVPTYELCFSEVVRRLSTHCRPIKAAGSRRIQISSRCTEHHKSIKALERLSSKAFDGRFAACYSFKQA
jgi:hypothetical protein